MSEPGHPAAHGLPPGRFPPSPVGAGHVAPAPRRVRATIAGQWIFDTRHALYVWEHPFYPQYHIPAADVLVDALRAGSAGSTPGSTTAWGTFRHLSILIGGQKRAAAARLVTASPHEALTDTYRFEWSALDHWFEEGRGDLRPSPQPLCAG